MGPHCHSIQRRHLLQSCGAQGSSGPSVLKSPEAGRRLSPGRNGNLTYNCQARALDMPVIKRLSLSDLRDDIPYGLRFWQRVDVGFLDNAPCVMELMKFNVRNPVLQRLTVALCRSHVCPASGLAGALLCVDCSELQCSDTSRPFCFNTIFRAVERYVHHFGRVRSCCL